MVQQAPKLNLRAGGEKYGQTHGLPISDTRCCCSIIYYIMTVVCRYKLLRIDWKVQSEIDIRTIGCVDKMLPRRCCRRREKGEEMKIKGSGKEQAQRIESIKMCLPVWFSACFRCEQLEFRLTTRFSHKEPAIS